MPIQGRQVARAPKPRGKGLQPAHASLRFPSLPLNKYGYLFRTLFEWFLAFSSQADGRLYTMHTFSCRLIVLVENAQGLQLSLNNSLKLLTIHPGTPG